MARIYAPLVRQNTTTTGTGPYTVSGTVAGHATFAAECEVSDVFRYIARAVDGSGVPTGDWEMGTGTYSGTNTIARTAVLRSSNGDAAVNWAAGTKTVDIISWVDAILGQNVDSLDPVTVTATKPSPVDADQLVMLDSAASGAPVLVTKAQLLAGVSGGLTSLALWDFWYFVRMATTGATAPDMFAGAAISSGTNTTAIPTGGQAGFNSYGVFLRSSTTANGGYRYLTTSLVSDYFGTISHKFRGQFLWRTSFTGRTVRMGYLDTNNSADAVDGAYFEIVGDVCSAKTASNSTRTTNATTLTLALDTAYTFDIDVNADGTEAQFRVYGGTSETALLDVTNTTNIPTTSARAFGAGIVATESSTTASDIGILYSLGIGTVEGFARSAGAVSPPAPSATAPAAFTNLQWDAQPTAVAGEMEYQITALPSDGGSAITALEYRVGAGAAIALTGTGTGNRTVTAGWTAGTAADTQIRAVNAIGAGAWSEPAINRTPAAGGGGGGATFFDATVEPHVSNVVTVTLPAGLTAEHTLYAFAAGRESNSTAVATMTAAGWTVVDTLEAGTFYGCRLFSAPYNVSNLEFTATGLGSVTVFATTGTVRAQVLAIGWWDNLPETHTAPGITALEGEMVVSIAVQGDATLGTVSAPQTDYVRELMRETPLPYVSIISREGAPAGATGALAHNAGLANYSTRFFATLAVEA